MALPRISKETWGVIYDVHVFVNPISAEQFLTATMTEMEAWNPLIYGLLHDVLFCETEIEVIPKAPFVAACCASLIYRLCVTELPLPSVTAEVYNEVLAEFRRDTEVFPKKFERMRVEMDPRIVEVFDIFTAGYKHDGFQTEVGYVLGTAWLVYTMLEHQNELTPVI